MNYLTIFALLLFQQVSIAQSPNFPGRITFPTVNTYSTQQLQKSFDQVIVVDARSEYEYGILHINGAINIALNNKSFKKALSRLDAKGKPIIFYCNGHTCFKSYKAVSKAKKAGFNNVFSYDAGIFDWANAHPDKTTMLNVTPMNPTKIISKATLNKHTLSPKSFLNKLTEDSIILDIRDSAQRGLISLFPYRQTNVSLQEKNELSDLLDQVIEDDVPLFIYDAAGKQVRWLQYYIEAKGIKNYYFMKGGSKNYLRNG